LRGVRLRRTTRQSPEVVSHEHNEGFFKTSHKGKGIKRIGLN
jgi:hypothetical protein